MNFLGFYATYLIHIHKHANICTENYAAPEVINLYYCTNFNVDA